MTQKVMEKEQRNRYLNKNLVSKYSILKTPNITNTSNTVQNSSTIPKNNNQSLFLRMFGESIIYGAGASIGMRVVDFFAGPKKIEVVHNEKQIENPITINKSPDCKDLEKIYLDCMKNNLDCEKQLSQMIQACK